jgi:endoglucanase
MLSAMRLAAALVVLIACQSWDAAEPVEDCAGEPSPPSMRAGFRVVGNEIFDSNAQHVVLRGVNRSGTEYRCIQGHGVFDGPDDEASVLAMKSWHINAVRVPLNESCWLGVNGAPPEFSGCRYKTAIRNYVNLLHRHGLIPILDLHWTGPNGNQARRLQPMPNLQHSRAFWYDVALTFRDDEAVIFEPYNEPFPRSNSGSRFAWECWRDGCEEYEAVRAGEESQPYAAAGMQHLVDVIRRAGSRHLILLGGVQYSNNLSRILEYLPHDPLANTAIAWHVYNYNQCSDVTCWDEVPRAVAATLPLVVTEFGQNDCAASMVTPLMDWLDLHAAGYLAWSWNAYGPCTPPNAMRRGSPWSLVADYTSGEPNSEYARAVRERFAGAPP